jgi:HAE1 family hydrophobic/amphiphilic exporter-1
LLTLWLFGSTLSLYSVIGLFLLMGIVKKNGIMICRLRAPSPRRGLRPALRDSRSQRRAFPSHHHDHARCSDGALPLALGYGADGSSRRPLGLVIVGGLIISQLITLYITPVVYLALEWFQERVLDKVPFRSGHMHHETAAEQGWPTGPGTGRSKLELSRC